MQSKYLAAFQRLKATANEHFILNSDRLIVEILPKEELKKGSIIMAPPKDMRSMTEENRAVLVLVLLVGEGYVDDDGNDIPVKYQPGEILMVPFNSLRHYTQFPMLLDYTANELAQTREGEVIMSWPSFESYEACKKAINDSKE